MNLDVRKMPAPGVDDWDLCSKPVCNDEHWPQEYHLSGQLIHRWLSEMKTDDRRMFRLRSQLLRLVRAWPVWRMSDDEVLSQAALLLKFNRLHLHVPSRIIPDPPPVLPADAEGSGGPAFPLSESQSSSSTTSARSGAPEPATFGSDLNAAQQAAALIAAAESGAPFCGQCGGQ